MKKIILLIIAIFGVVQMQAQNINPEVDHVPGKRQQADNCSNAECCSGWVLDANATGGFLWQRFTTVNHAANYLDGVNRNVSSPEFKSGFSRGLDVQVGYFFGPKRTFGIGAGLMYMYQHGDITMDNFHVEYRSTDYFGNTFRQVLTGNGRIKESISTSNLSIPVVFKYKTWFTKKVGFTADAGLLFNVLSHNEYTTNSSFDYEAIYKYTGSQGSIVPVYDASPVPSSDALLITQKQYLISSSAGGNIQDYFNSLRNSGYNVGLAVKPNSKSGTVRYNGGSVGILLRPAVSLALTEQVSLNFGVYYLYQHFSNDAQANYRITNKVGEYSSMMNSVSGSSNHSLGFSAGVRYCICKKKACAAPAPPEEPAQEEPPVASPAEPEDDEPEPEHVDVSTPILFDLDKTEIKPASYPVLAEAIRIMNEQVKAGLVIHGYTDATGKPSYNKTLSALRAAAVKKYLENKGVSPKRMKTVGHGPKHPAESNKTPEGRMQNRRVIIKVKDVR